MAAAAGNSAATSGAGTASVITPLSLSHSPGYSLNFGTFAVGSAGTVTVSPTNGAGSATGGVVFTGTSATALDVFAVSAQGGTGFSISSSAGTVSSGGNSMTFTTVPSLSGGACFGTGPALCTFTVGGTLSVNAAQPAGAYTGTYTATVTYQ